MDSVKLYYFDVKGLGEPIRLLLVHLDIDFEDIRVKAEDWPALKPKMPFGTMPVLEVNGVKYAQSMAMGRYLGVKHGLSGTDIIENFEIDQILDLLTDIRIKAAPVHYETDEAKKKAKHEELMKDFYPKTLGIINDAIIKNNGHIALGRLTWADFFVLGSLDGIKLFLQLPDLEEKYPGFKKLRENLFKNPKVKAFVEKHT